MISRFTYENIWRNEYPNLTPLDRLALAQAILSDLHSMNPDDLVPEFKDAKYTHRLVEHCHIELGEAG